MDPIPVTPRSGGAPHGTGSCCMATDKVHFAGEVVAAVAAVGRHVGADAIGLIDVELEPVKPVAHLLETIKLTVHGRIQAPLMYEVGATGMLGVPTKRVDLSSTQRGGSFAGKGNARGVASTSLLTRKVGAALLEEYPCSCEAQPQATTFVDYLAPSINEVPVAEKAARVTPSPVSPLGAKGCGEGALYTAPAAIMCAINDALAPLGVLAREVPASPQRLCRLLRDCAE